jgi:tellurite methyltransferase
MSIQEWNDRYSRGDHADQRPLALIERVARDYTPGLALDLACGLGRHSLCLAYFGWTVVALDASEVAVAKLSQSAQSQGLAIQSKVQDLESSDFSIEAEGYDLICDCLYLQRSLIPRIQSGVRRGGLAAFVFPMLDDMPGLKPMNTKFLVHPGDVLLGFEDWEIIAYKEERETPHGRKLAQLLARRPVRL